MVVSSVGECNIVIWSTELVNWPIYVISSVDNTKLYVDEQTWWPEKFVNVVKSSLVANHDFIMVIIEMSHRHTRHSDFWYRNFIEFESLNLFLSQSQKIYTTQVMWTQYWKCIVCSLFHLLQKNGCFTSTSMTCHLLPTRSTTKNCHNKVLQKSGN